MHSIHDMVQRFRNTKPTPREERRKQWKQGKIQEMWWIRDEVLAEKDDESDIYHSRDSLEGGFSSNEESYDTNIKERSKADEQYRSVDGMISQDIEHFLKVEAHDPDRLRTHRVPRVLPSPNPTPLCGEAIKTFGGSRPPTNLVPVPDRRKAVGSAPNIVEEIDDSAFLRHFALEPLVYTGTAELRDGTALSSSQEEDFQTIAFHSEEEATGANQSTAAGVASDLDAVLENLRSGINQDEQSGSPDVQHTQWDNLPVNLGQIGRDLDTKLLQFTLMARAREQAAGEADTTEEIEKVAWKQEETKRIEEMVRQECATLQDAAQGTNKDLNSVTRLLPEEFGPAEASDWPLLDLHRATTLGCCPRWNNQGLVGSSALQAAFPSTSLPDSTMFPWEHADANEEAAAHQMAHIIRSVEARVKIIQALDFDHDRLNVDESNDNQAAERMQEQSRDIQEQNQATGTSTTRKSKSEGDTSPLARSKEGGNIGNIAEEQLLSLKSDGAVSEAGSSKVVTADAASIPREMELMPDSSLIMDGSRKVAYISQQSGITFRPRNYHEAMPRSWLYGKATLEQTGRCISAELDVAMLCMQKRLRHDWKPMCDENPGGSHQGQTPNKVVEVGQKDDNGSPSGKTTEENTSPDEAAQDQLQMLADNMAISNKNLEIDRAKDVEFRNILGGERSYHNREIRKPINGAAEGRRHDAAVHYATLFPTRLRYNHVPEVGRLPVTFEHVHAESGGSFISHCHNEKPSHKAPPWILPTSCGWYESTDSAHDDDGVNFRLQPSVPERSRDCIIGSGGEDNEHNDELPGFALARARRRLRNFQKTHRSVSKLSNASFSGVGRRNDASCTDRRKVPPIVGAQQMLCRLRKMRLRYASDASP